MRAYILLDVAPQVTVDVYDALKSEPYVTEAAVIHGPYDCIALVEHATLDDINEIVLRLRAIEGVRDTTTCLVMQSFERTDRLMPFSGVKGRTAPSRSKRVPAR
ncbi:MAG TPA: Lrp/AsnC ligand binding domain-containing protein [Aggregatilineales bacterium]|jgi:DNA-binding Lrp family transcriptional regulator|nr:Lrp/AsnC family transcriptional regulator [Chloroflexota bacterium]HOA22471.1 Lrp/AsnC ligand binding domain-containing protein [Aggregatilineales bacterium]HPV08031.1 Lrp/AsnC ligand binding domain-containing protein [Aggregatilineales bacterium]HQA66948.1 Lrp/AsnC ligand binding domain-containing protein [Aggregatilineales bacterium]HQE17519.1 Lrp/AsnC ligand binding domain-containing protein [Aggregatilineales bacterium]